ncbi:MAG: hypothetical protein V4490_01700 [Pseudomonadota bacterium]
MIVDDVITAGTAVRASLPFFNPPESRVSGLIIALDRQERGNDERSAVTALVQDVGIRVISIVGLSDILTYVLNTPSLAEWAKPIADYRDTYGVATTD